MDDSDLISAVINATDAQAELINAALKYRQMRECRKPVKSVRDFPTGRTWTIDQNVALWNLVEKKNVSIKEAAKQIGKSYGSTTARISDLRKWMNS